MPAKREETRLSQIPQLNKHSKTSQNTHTAPSHVLEFPQFQKYKNDIPKAYKITKSQRNKFKSQKTTKVNNERIKNNRNPTKERTIKKKAT